MVPTLRIAIHKCLGEVKSHSQRLVSLEKLNEAIKLAIHAMVDEKKHKKACYDKALHKKELQYRDLSLFIDLKGIKENLSSREMGLKWSIKLMKME